MKTSHIPFAKNLTLAAMLGLLCLSSARGWAAVYYVASGAPTPLSAIVPAAGVDDRSAGRGSISTPFKTIQYAAQQAAPGDTVIVRNGTYAESVSLGYNIDDTLMGTQSGTPTAWITYKAENMHHAFLHPTAATTSPDQLEYGGCFELKSALHNASGSWSNAPNPVAYIRIQGFDLENPGHEGDGIVSFLAHHIVIANNVIHDNPGGGIGMGNSDYITIEDNQVYNNCRTSSYNESGISFGSIPWDQATGAGLYHNVIQRNTVYNNYIAAGAISSVTGQPIAHTDGNGIIVDTAPYELSVLIQNNVVYNNGGRGIQLVGAANVTVLNNTCYHDFTDPAIQDLGEISMYRVTWDRPNDPADPLNAPATNCKVLSNICYPAGNKAGLAIQDSSVNCSVQNNWIYGGVKAIDYPVLGNPAFPVTTPLSGCVINSNFGADLTGGNPLFVAPGLDGTANFHLQGGSPCLYASWSKPADDHDGYPRPFDDSWYAVGAYGYIPTITINSGGALSGTFLADTDFSAGSVDTVKSVIDMSGVINPAPQAVYQSERYRNFTYTVPGLVANGSYTVRLHFAEIKLTGAGKRVFNVTINGTPALTNFDIFAKVGANTADIEQFAATANAKGQIVIKFTGVVNNAKVSGVEIVPCLGRTIAIAAGGSASGAFAADADFSGGTAGTSTNVIDTSGVMIPAPQSVYQNERFGNFTYTIPNLIVGHTYTVRLHFAEIYFTGAGQRVFNVAINGVPALTDFDIFAKVGANKADVEQFTAIADASGNIAIAFTNVVNNAKVSGIELLPANG